MRDHRECTTSGLTLSSCATLNIDYQDALESRNHYYGNEWRDLASADQRLKVQAGNKRPTVTPFLAEAGYYALGSA